MSVSADNTKKIMIYGGGTVFHVRHHLALCAPAYGGTAKRLHEMCGHVIPDMTAHLRLTRMAGGHSGLWTNEDIANHLDEHVLPNPSVRVVIMTAALCDYEGRIGGMCGKDAGRLRSLIDFHPVMMLRAADKVISRIRKDRKDIFLVGFKTTFEEDTPEMFNAGLRLCKQASCNLVLVNDVASGYNLIVTPEESSYSGTYDRGRVLRDLLDMTRMRTQLNFTRTTVVDGKPIAWDSPLVPETLRKVVQFCIDANAYKPFNGSTAGHFACKLSDNTFLTSIRKTDFNQIASVGMVKVTTDGPDNVIAIGAKPSVGGQSQRIVFQEHPDTNCIVHFHCPMLAISRNEIPIMSQREFECGSHECGKNTSKGLAKFGNLYAVYLDNHGPNIVFNSTINPDEVINFITANFDLGKKTVGYKAQY